MASKSILEIYDIRTDERTVLNEFDRIIEAPNWLADGDTLLYNSEGHIYRYSISSGKEERLDTGECVNCNNDHIPSPGMDFLGVSHSDTGWESNIYVVPLKGGSPRRITAYPMSFLHGWSGDGKELLFTGFRNNKVDIYSIPADGGDEHRLTDGVGYNDGSEFSPDDKHIWFNSTREGLMQIFRMDRDGENLVRITHSDDNCWFPHVSPDGKKVVYLTFRKGDLEPFEHLPDKNVELRCMDYSGENDRSLIKMFGGQGTINVNSWASDSSRFAFVSYRM